MQTQKKTISWDAKSIILDGKRIWLHDGEIHYFRHHGEEWHDVLRRAKRAGMNCVSTYIAWNYHEENEGCFDFSGDRDLYRFIDLAHELGLYVMARTGPYICGEWAGGGIPGWLGVRDEIDLRTNDPVFMEAVARWYARLLPGLVERQVTLGGAIVTFQDENEYARACTGPRREYVYGIRDMLLRAGVEVPITGCNAHPHTDNEVVLYYSSKPEDWALDGIVMTYNCGLTPEPVRHLRKLQPNAPVFVSELWAGGMVFRGTDRTGWPETPALGRAITEFLSLGAQLCYYMIEGGTNHGYWAGCNIATSYESDYPVREGGVVGERYRALRLFNLFSSSFGPFLAESDEDTKLGIKAEEGLRLVVRTTSAGSILFLTAADGRRNASLILPGGEILPVSLNEFSAAILPFNLELIPGVRLEVANTSLLFIDPVRRIIILHAPGGTEACLRVNGREIRMTVRQNTVEQMAVGEAKLIFLDTEMAKRCWPLEEEIVYGPDDVGERRVDGRIEMTVTAVTPPVRVIASSGTERRWTGSIPAKPAPLSGMVKWQSGVAPEVEEAAVAGWKPLSHPEYQDVLGIRHGYVWFRASVESEKDGMSELIIPSAQSNVIIYVNGQYVGILGVERSVNQRMDYVVPMQRLHTTLGLPLKKGVNHIVCLAEDSGHTLFETGSVGMSGDAYVDALPYEPKSYAVSDQDDAEGFRTVSFELPVGEEEKGILVFYALWSGLKDVAANGKKLQPISHRRDFWHGYVLPGDASGKVNRIELRVAAGSTKTVVSKMTIHLAPKSGVLRDWAWKPFREPAPDAGLPSQLFTEENTTSVVDTSKPILLAPTYSGKAVDARSFQAKWHKSVFARPEGERPVFLTLGNLYKGQIWLNGRNAGRFWKQPQTQTHYYLPRCWMKDENEIVIFEEAGLSPEGAALAWKESDPYHVDKLPPVTVVL